MRVSISVQNGLRDGSNVGIFRSLSVKNTVITKSKKECLHSCCNIEKQHSYV